MNYKECLNHYHYLTIKQAQCKYIKSLKDKMPGCHLIKDLQTGIKEIYCNSKNFAGFALIYKNTHLEYCCQYKFLGH